MMGGSAIRFNEYECGHWYARAMSSYALLQGLTGVPLRCGGQGAYIAPSIRGDFRSFLATAAGYGIVGVKNGKPFVESVHGKIDTKDIHYTPKA